MQLRYLFLYLGEEREKKGKRLRESIGKDSKGGWRERRIVKGRKRTRKGKGKSRKRERK